MLTKEQIFSSFIFEKQYIVTNPNYDKIVITNNLMSETPFGAEKYAIKMCNYLSKYYQVHTFQQIDKRIGLNDKIIVHSGCYMSFYSRKYFFSIAKQIQDISPACIICNAGVGTQIYFWAIISYLTQVPIIGFLHNQPQYMIDTLTYQSSILSSPVYSRQCYKYPKECFEALLDSLSAVAYLLPSYVDKRYKNTFVYYNCIDIPRDVNLNKQDYLLYVGRMNQTIKRTNLLLDAITDEKLVVAGTSYSNDVDGFIDIKNYPNVDYRGYVNNVSKLYNNANILIIPSLIEGLPTVALEAMSYGVPVIGMKDCEAMCNIINEQNGWLIDTKDIKQYLRVKPTMKMRQQCIEFAQQFSISNVMENIHNSIQQVIANGY